MNKKYIIWAIIILLAIGGVYFFFIREKSINVNKVTTENLTVEKSVSVNGEVTSNNHAELSFGATGRVSKIYVTKDTVVQKGALLAQLDTASAYQSLQALEDVVDIAKREKDEFVLEYRDSERRRTYGNEKYDETIRKLDERIHKAQADYKAQQANLTNLTIRAPFDGTIVDITKDESEAAALGERVITIVDTSSMYFEADLEQEDFGYVNLNLPTEITLDSYEEQEKTFIGEIIEIPQFINPNGDSITVKISLPETDVPVLYGMTGEARIIIEEKENVQALTFDEVFTDEDGNNYVWIAEKQNGANRLKKMPVEVGLEGDIYTEVITDLSNTTVILPTNDNIELEEGLKVKIANEK